MNEVQALALAKLIMEYQIQGQLDVTLSIIPESILAEFFHSGFKIATTVIHSSGEVL